MRELLPVLQKWREQHKQAAIATVIKTWGSAPRPAGAVMAVSGEGEMCGSVSGGCVETAVVEEALRVITSGGAKILEYGVSNEEAWSVGLACGGSIRLFLQPLPWQRRLVQALLPFLAARQTGVLLTCVNDTTARFGQQLLLQAEGPVVSDFADETMAQQLAARFDLRRPPRAAAIETFGGNDLFVQPLLPQPRLLIVGGVHIAQSLARLGRELDYEVILVDPREAFANRDRFPGVETIINAWPQEAFASIPLDANTFVVFLTHDPKIDDPGIIAALSGRPAYIGALGSKRTHEKRVQRLREAGIAATELAQVFAPAGLDIRARTPSEIALSILAEITAVQRQADLLKNE